MTRLFPDIAFTPHRIIVFMVSLVVVCSLVLRHGADTTLAWQNPTLQFVPVQPELSPPGEQKTKQPSGGSLPPILIPRLRLDKGSPGPAGAQSSLGTRYRLISLLLLSETASSRL
jgi:hypothetical protein